MVPTHFHSEAQDPTVKGFGTLRTVLGPVHADQLAFQADVADTVFLRDRLGHRVGEQRERLP